MRFSTLVAVLLAIGGCSKKDEGKADPKPADDKGAAKAAPDPAPAPEPAPAKPAAAATMKIPLPVFPEATVDEEDDVDGVVLRASLSAPKPKDEVATFYAKALKDAGLDAKREDRGTVAILLSGENDKVIVSVEILGEPGEPGRSLVGITWQVKQAE